MELGVKSEDGESSSLEPRPDIHHLFFHYNALYFDDALGSCSVYWSDSRTIRHKIICSGSYKRSTVGGRCKDKMKFPKDDQGNKGGKSEGPHDRARQTKKRAQNVGQMTCLHNTLKCDTHDDSFTSSVIKSSYANDSQRRATPLKVEGGTPASKIPKRPRTCLFAEGYKLAYPEKENVHEPKKEDTPVGQWFAFYGYGESDEDIKPLINKRTIRRRMEKLAKLKERRDAGGVGAARPLKHGESSGHGTIVADARKAHDAPPPADKIIYILDD